MLQESSSLRFVSALCLASNASSRYANDAVIFHFELFSFRKYAKSMCENLNIKGWIRVSPRGTEYGKIQGEKEKVDEMYVLTPGNLAHFLTSLALCSQYSQGSVVALARQSRLQD